MPQVTAGGVRVGLERAADVAEDAHQLVGQRAAVGVAQDERPGAGLAGRPQRGERVVAVGLVAVEEVLGVVDHLAAVVGDEADRVRDHVQVLAGVAPRTSVTWSSQLLPKIVTTGRLGRDQLAAGWGPPPGLLALWRVRPEGRELRVLPGDLAGRREELDVLGVGARPAALDEGHAVLVEHARDAQLVRERERDVLALGAVAEGRVVEDDRLVGHGGVGPCRGVREGSSIGVWPVTRARRAPAVKSRSGPR